MRVKYVLYIPIVVSVMLGNVNNRKSIHNTITPVGPIWLWVGLAADHLGLGQIFSFPAAVGVYGYEQTRFCYSAERCRVRIHCYNIESNVPTMFDPSAGI